MVIFSTAEAFLVGPIKLVLSVPSVLAPAALVGFMQVPPKPKEKKPLTAKQKLLAKMRR